MTLIRVDRLHLVVLFCSGLEGGSQKPEVCSGSVFLTYLDLVLSLSPTLLYRIQQKYLT